MLLFGVLLALVSSAAAQEDPARTGFRPDAPTYAVRGPYHVGARAFVDESGDNPLDVMVWYPALIPDGSEETITYTAHWKIDGVYPELTSEIAGHALQDAELDTSQAPYPLVVFSHGFASEAVNYAYLVEHLASYGFIVVAPDHKEFFDDELSDLWRTTVMRPLDVQRALDYAETLTADGGAMAGFIDMEQVAVAGQSYGGYTALAAANARFDMEAYTERCAVLAPDDPDQFLCVLVARMDNMASIAGLDAAPEGLWPAMGDPRVDSIITMAGDSYMFDRAGLAEITLPVLAIGGTLDSSTPYEWGVRPTYDSVSSEQKILITLENADHFLFLEKCADAPSIVDMMGAFFFCSDPVWDMDRAHDLIDHFNTAFLLTTLYGDTDAAAALSPDAVQFNGVQYEAQGY
jgi:predicted dienelactone hydrolase